MEEGVSGLGGPYGAWKLNWSQTLGKARTEPESQADGGSRDLKGGGWIPGCARGSSCRGSGNEEGMTEEGQLETCLAGASYANKMTPISG